MLTLTRKVLLGLGALAALALITHIIAIGGLRRIEGRVTEMTSVSQPLSGVANALETAAVETSLSVFRYLADPSPAARAQIESAAGTVNQLTERLSQLARSPELRETLSRFRASFDEFYATGRRLIQLKDREGLAIEASAASLVTLDRRLERELPLTEERNANRLAVQERLVVLRGEIVNIAGRLSTHMDEPERIDRDLILRELTRARAVLTAASTTSPSPSIAGWLRSVGDELGRLAALRLETANLRAAMRREFERFAAGRREIGELLDNDLRPRAERDLAAVQRETRTAIDDAVTLAGGLAFFSALIVLAFMAYVSRNIVRPLDWLASAARQVGGGDFRLTQPLRRTPKNEIGRVMGAFTTMTAQVRESQLHLTRHNETLNDAVAKRTTELERANEDLRLAAEIANRANATKSAFLAGMSHELRTPLNAIMGFSEILASDQMRRGIDPRYREYAGDVLSSARHLLSIVDDLLDMAKVESGKFELRMEVIAISEIVRDCGRMLKSRLEEAHLTFTTDLDMTTDLVRADHRITKQILLNLLSNALKFTPAGGRISVTSRPEGALLAVSVTDTGIGMTPEQVRHATDLFFQADSSLGRKYGGTGLGLTLVRAFVERHGGTLTIESEPGRGTTVTARLPRADLQVAPEPPRDNVVRVFPQPVAPLPVHPAANG